MPHSLFINYLVPVTMAPKSLSHSCSRLFMISFKIFSDKKPSHATVPLIRMERARPVDLLRRILYSMTGGTRREGHPQTPR
jgi:hypothetical protein